MGRERLPCLRGDGQQLLWGRGGIVGNGLTGMWPGAATSSHTTPGAHAPEGRCVQVFPFPSLTKPTSLNIHQGLSSLSLFTDLATLLILWGFSPCTAASTEVTNSDALLRGLGWNIHQPPLE